jgi:hypothetical protein
MKIPNQWLNKDYFVKNKMACKYIKLEFGSLYQLVPGALQMYSMEQIRLAEQKLGISLTVYVFLRPLKLLTEL